MQFLKGARAAYEIIVTAFAEGNRKTLKDLLSREVYEALPAPSPIAKAAASRSTRASSASSRPTSSRPS